MTSLGDYFSNSSYHSREIRWRNILIILFRGLLILHLHERKILSQSFLSSLLPTWSKVLSALSWLVAVLLTAVSGSTFPSLPSVFHVIIIWSLFDQLLLLLRFLCFNHSGLDLVPRTCHALPCLRFSVLLFSLPKQLFPFFPLSNSTSRYYLKYLVLIEVFPYLWSKLSLGFHSTLYIHLSQFIYIHVFFKFFLRLKATGKECFVHLCVCST